jgi:hypothetical protein
MPNTRSLPALLVSLALAAPAAAAPDDAFVDALFGACELAVVHVSAGIATVTGPDRSVRVRSRSSCTHVAATPRARASTVVFVGFTTEDITTGERLSELSRDVTSQPMECAAAWTAAMPQLSQPNISLCTRAFHPTPPVKLDAVTIFGPAFLELGTLRPVGDSGEEALLQWKANERTLVLAASAICEIPRIIESTNTILGVTNIHQFPIRLTASLTEPASKRTLGIWRQSKTVVGSSCDAALERDRAKLAPFFERVIDEGLRNAESGGAASSASTSPGGVRPKPKN